MAAEGDAQPLSQTRATVKALSESKRRGPPLAHLPGPTELHAVAYDQHNRQVDTYDAMDNFWKRYNKVLLDKLAIDRERQLLEAENLELRSILKQYLDGKQHTRRRRRIIVLLLAFARLGLCLYHCYC